IAGPTNERILAVAAKDDVVAVVAEQCIITTAAVQDIVTTVAVDGVGPVCADQDIVAVVAIDDAHWTPLLRFPIEVPLNHSASAHRQRRVKEATSADFCF